MRLLSESLVDDQYRASIAADLKQAEICRFSVAYVSDAGIRSIGRNALLRVLSDEDSFGVSSMSCSCGYHPLLNLQRELSSETLRLKYFMDPSVCGTDEPNGLVLMHSKLVYLKTIVNDEPKSVVYLGSHNWTGRALGPGGPRNAEASYRFEFPFSPDHLLGIGDDLPSQVNRHLLSAHRNPCCLPATASNEQTFNEWDQAVCKNRAPSSLDEVLLILAVRSDGSDPGRSLDELQGKGIYMQCLEEEEGTQVWDAPDQTIVMVWDSAGALANGRQPTLLLCNKNTRNAGGNSERHGTNQSANPIAGFAGVLLDREQGAKQTESNTPARSVLALWSRSEAEVFDLDYPTISTECEDFDGRLNPKYQFLLEVEAVVHSAEEAVDNARFVWDRSTFAVAKRKDDAKYVKLDGYVVPDEVRSQIERSLEEDFGIDLSRDNVKAKPQSESTINRLKIGKRFASNPLHETFVARETQQAPNEVYRQAFDELLTIDLDPDCTEAGTQQKLFANPIERSQRVFTAKIEVLKEVWREAAKSMFK